MGIATEIITNPLVLSPLAAILFNNLIKVIIYSLKHAKLKLDYLYKGYGGMPSGHSAFLGALLAAIFVEQGLSSSFYITISISILLIYNLTSVKWFFSKESEVFEQLFKIHKKDKKEIEFPGRLVGHTLLEIIIGLIIGIIVGVFLTFSLY